MHASSSSDNPSPSSPNQTRGWRFWTIFAALAITSILSALDASVISTAMPTIVNDLDSSNAYVWIANAYFLTMTAFQPLYGQTANIFGRRSLIVIAVVLFAVGSAVSGAAKSTAALIAGRTVQGIGGGGINVLVDIIVCDLVPLRERSKFMGVIFSVFAVGLSLGPVIGGLMTQRVSWRWIFYLNLPICGVALVLLVLFLKVQYKKDSGQNMVRRIDFVGNALLIASVLAVLLALTWGGTKHPWSSWRTVVPLILGLLGQGGFLALQSSKLIPEPTMPIRLFSNRTSLSTFALTFVHAILTYWLIYFLPVYFQSALEASPIQSGVNLLASAITVIPFAILAGGGLTKLGRYRPFHFVGIGLLTIAFGLFTRLDAHSSTGYWVGIQILGAAGTGILLTTTLPAIQAPLGEGDVAVATATWGFLRSFGGVWGVAIPSAVFNSQVNDLLLGRVRSAELRQTLANGGAYAVASRKFMRSLSQTPALKAQVLGVYVDSLKLVWQVGIAFGLLGFLIALVVKEIPMREQLETEFGMVDYGDRGSSESPGDVEPAHEKQPGSAASGN